jgi:thioredoxin reductase
MSELTAQDAGTPRGATREASLAPTTCCTSKEQESCCQPSDKPECCGTSVTEPKSCGCRALEHRDLPVAVIGAGPVGLAAAAQLVSRGEQALVLEAGLSVAASVLRWGHVRLFSPWRHNVDAVAGAMLEASGWRRPSGDEHPTGRELVERYLAPLAALPAIQPCIRLDSRVLGVSRLGLDRTKTHARELSPFVLRVLANGVEENILARAVIDASGTYESPNPLGASGIPALGEGATRDRIFYGAPDVLGRDRARYAGRRVLVVGSGHSAFGTLLDLATLRSEAPGTEIAWALRRPSLDAVFGGGDADELAERGRLGRRMRDLVAQDTLRIFTSFGIARITRTAAGVMVASDDRELPAVDEIVAATGFRPDVSILRDVRLQLDPIVESPTALAPLIDPNLHSCGTVPPHGFEELKHPEPDFYVVGMKSYGRAPTFLMLTGYEQVRSVVAALTGDLQAARQVQLKLPETGVCSSDLGGATAACGSAGCGTPVALKRSAAVPQGCC